MALLKVSKDAQAWLVGQPETGMGYQLVSLQDELFALVIGSALALRFTNQRDLFSQLVGYRLQIARYFSEEVQTSLFEGLDAGEITTEFERVILRSEPRARALLGYRSMPARSAAIELVEEVHPREYEIFFRFSANSADPRILTNGAFVAGTYATTMNDFRVVPSGFSAVGRYAIPQPASACFVYAISSKSDYKIGTTVPNFGQAGGGVEVLFHKGAQPSYSKPHKISKG